MDNFNDVLAESIRDALKAAGCHGFTMLVYPADQRQSWTTEIALLACIYNGHTAKIYYKHNHWYLLLLLPARPIGTPERDLPYHWPVLTIDSCGPVLRRDNSSRWPFQLERCDLEAIVHAIATHLKG